VFGPGRICGVVAARTAAEAIRQFRLAAGPGGRSQTLEVRLDYLQNPVERLTFLRWLGRQRVRPVVIATCRRRQGSGQFRGRIEDELAVLKQAVEAGCAWCDVEIETASRIDSSELREALAPAHVLVSAHDFRRVPKNLGALARRLDRTEAAAIKIAAQCRSLADARRLLDMAHGRHNVVAIPMGEAVFPARILALREGSALAYAAVETATAPGQLSLDATREVYHLNRRFGRAAAPTRRTRVYGVIGDPVGHSLSPLMHNTAFAARRVDAVYLPFHVRDLRDFLAAVKNFRMSGFSVTLPHKQRILRYLDDCDPLAAEVGAVNTVVVRGQRLYGYNTDYVGVLRAIEKRVPLPSARVLLLGAGGAARAAAFALARAGAAVFIWARRAEQARALARAAKGEAIERRALGGEFFDAIVNCTPVGMYPGGGSPLVARELNARVVMDTIYRPQTTELLRRAKGRGIETISGVEMFLAQGIAQWEMWMGERAPEKAMRRAVLAALDREEKASAGREGRSRR
jgi:3-dehydroquinate dehydratase/shikimate dehydrogenase